MNRLRWRSITAPDQLAHVARRSLAGRNAVRVHTHDFAEVLWVERGSGQHEANGRRTNLAAGDLVLVRPRDRHGFFDGDADFTIVNVAFPAAVLSHLRRRYFPRDAAFFGGRSPAPAVFAVDAGRLRLLSAESAELARHATDRLALERFLLNLLHDLAGRTKPAGLASCPPWLLRALDELRQPEHLVGGAARLARLAGRSPEHLARVLHAATGLRPIDLVTRARMDHAAGQLALTERPIVEVALACGFESLSHFYRVFRQHHGETPRAYRLRSQAALR
jgi:AraC family transcriptional regulator, dual regulator of chb operon